MLGLGCCWLERTLCSATKSSPLSRWWASFPMYVKRMVVMYCETVLRLCGIRPPALRYGASSYISMGMLAFIGSSSIWCLSIFTSALLTGGIPMYFKGGWMLTNRLHPKMLCPLPHALRSMASSYVVEGCGNSVSKHLNAVYNLPPHYCRRASLSMIGLGCCGLRKNTLQCLL